MSVDLVGSTAFKSRVLNSAQRSHEFRPQWVSQWEEFYKDFPNILNQRYESAIGSEAEGLQGKSPRLWKAIGDEIVFVSRMVNGNHLDRTMAAFVQALKDYGRSLEQRSIQLDVKGTAWIAAFPVDNIAVHLPHDLPSKDPSKDLPDETFEDEVDLKPSEFDFLGPDIDAGFRIGKHSGADSLALSFQLAWLLSCIGNEAAHPIKLTFKGKEVLRGVMNDRPYPIILLDSERSKERGFLKSAERALTNSEIGGAVIKSYLEAFMNDVRIDWPHLEGCAPTSLPNSFLSFKKAWTTNVKDVNAISKGEEQQGVDGDPNVEVPTELASNLEAQAAKFTSHLRIPWSVTRSEYR